MSLARSCLNDVVVKSDGAIWFTDPSYGILSDDGASRPRAKSAPATSIASIRPQAICRSSPMISRNQRPGVFADESLIYISDTGFRIDIHGDPSPPRMTGSRSTRRTAAGSVRSWCPRSLPTAHSAGRTATASSSPPRRRSTPSTCGCKERSVRTEPWPLWLQRACLCFRQWPDRAAP